MKYIVYKKLKPKITTLEMELALVGFYTNSTINASANLVVPNIHWGAKIHECDLFVLSKAGYATEVEIKISKADLIKDKEKAHQHLSPKIKQLYFAIPDYLIDYIEHIPERAGIYVVSAKTSYGRRYVKCIRKAKATGNYKYSDAERYKIARLGAIRIWPLKAKIQKLKELNELNRI